MTPAVRIEWRAGRDGLGHAVRGRATACGAPPEDPRFAWPVMKRCEMCRDALARRTSTELRARFAAEYVRRG